MKFLVNPDHPLHKCLSRIVDLYLLNVLFLITSCMGILIGPAITALYVIHFARMTEYSETSLFASFFSAYKENFKRGLILQLVLMAMGICVLASYRCTSVIAGVAGIVALPGLIITTLILLLMAVMIFPYTARYKNSLIKTFKVCLQVAVLNLKKAIFLLVFPSVIIIVAIQSNISFTVMVILLIFVGFSAISAINAQIILPVFTQYE